MRISTKTYSQVWFNHCTSHHPWLLLLSQVELAHYILGTLWGRTLWMFVKNHFPFFFFLILTKCTLAKSYRDDPIINAIPSAPFEPFLGFNFVNSYLVITQIYILNWVVLKDSNCHTNNLCTIKIHKSSLKPRDWASSAKWLKHLSKQPREKVYISKTPLRSFSVKNYIYVPVLMVIGQTDSKSI